MRQFPSYSQRDPRWAGQRLGTVDGTTIGSDGCYVTSMAMVAGYYGHPITPDKLDDIFTARGLYADGNLVIDGMLSTVYPAIEYVHAWDYSDRPADMAKLHVLSNDLSLMTILELDFDHDASDDIQTHFVCLVGSKGTADSTIIADPWFGTVGPFAAHYGSNPAQTVQKYVVYKSIAPRGNAR